MLAATHISEIRDDKRTLVVVFLRFGADGLTLVAPVEDPVLRDDLLDTLTRCFADDTNAWELDVDGNWTRRTSQGPESRSVQRELMVGHVARATEERPA